jgi:hypothetical protein
VQLPETFRDSTPDDSLRSRATALLLDLLFWDSRRMFMRELEVRLLGAPAIRSAAEAPTCDVGGTTRTEVFAGWRRGALSIVARM